VLLNLAGNAIKFTETGGVSIIVEPGIWPGEIEFQVRDTGIGILPEQQQRIFLEFEQADSGADRKYTGSGLGLAISKRIVERMQGRISVESVPGHGATFQVSLPLVAAEGVEAPLTAPDMADMAVLLVAPSAIEASLVARRLTRWGAKTCVVSDAEVAVAVFPEQVWDAILIDHALGAEQVERLMRSVGKSIARRIVLVTPASRHELAAMRDAGFTGYLVKPVRAASLAARLHGDAAWRGAEQAELEEVAAPRTAPELGGGLSVLVGEDNEINALLARALLLKLGHRPTIAGSGAATIESWLAARAAGTPYDLVLMDVNMPNLDGHEATRKIRAIETESGDPRTPIIALTASAFSEDRDTCLAAGMDDFLVKPLDRERLADLLVALPARRLAHLAA
jgi:CheY-like chemotaxis protein